MNPNPSPELDGRVSCVRVAASSSHKRPAAARRYGSLSLSDVSTSMTTSVGWNRVLYSTGEASKAENTGDVHGQGSGQHPPSILHLPFK
jgi:hypothetical protein